MDNNNSQDLDEQKIFKLISPGPYHLIDEGALKVDQATNLGKAQIENFGFPEISSLFTKGKLSLDEVRDLTEQEIENLTKPNIYQLIIDNDLKVNKAKNLDKSQRENLGVDEIRALFSYSKLDLDQVKYLTEQQIQNLKEFINYIDTENEYSYRPELYQLISQDLLNTDQANQLTKKQTKPYSFKQVCKLISKNILSADEAINLDDQTIQILDKHPQITNLIFEEKLNLEQLTEEQAQLIATPGILALIESGQLTVDVAINDLSDKQKNILDNEGLAVLIKNNKVNWDEIKQLELSEVKYNILNNKDNIYSDKKILINLFTEDKLTLEDFNKLTDEQASLLQQQHVRQLLYNEVLKIDDFKSLDDRQVTNLNQENITKLLSEGKLDLETAKDLADDELVEFDKKGTISTMFKQKDEKKEISSEDVLARAHIKRAIRSQALEEVLGEFLNENSQNKHMYLTPSSKKKKQEISNKFDRFTNSKQRKTNPIVDYKYDIVNNFLNIIKRMADKRYASGRGWTRTLEHFYNKIEAKIPADQKRDFRNDLVLIRSQLDYLKQNPDCLKDLEYQFNPELPSPIVSIDLNYDKLTEVFNREDRNKDLQKRHAKQIIEVVSSEGFQNLLRNFQTEHLNNTPSNNSNLPSTMHCGFFSHQPADTKNQQISKSIGALLQHKEIQTGQTLPYTENGELEISNDKLEIVDRFWDVIEAMNSDKGYDSRNTLDKFYEKLEKEIGSDSSELRTIKEQLDSLKDNPQDTLQPFAASNNISDRIQRLKQQTDLLRDSEPSQENSTTCAYVPRS